MECHAGDAVAAAGRLPDRSVSSPPRPTGLLRLWHCHRCRLRPDEPPAGLAPHTARTNRADFRCRITGIFPIPRLVRKLAGARFLSRLAALVDQCGGGRGAGLAAGTVAGRRELGGKIRPHHTGLHRTPRPVINVASLAQQSFRGGTPGFAVAAPVIAVGGSWRLTGDHWALVEEPSTARAPASSLDATGHHHHGISGPEHRQLLFRPHHHAAAKPVR